MELHELVSRIQERLDKGAYANEAAVSMGIVLPVLQALGWDTSDPEQVMPEYSSGKGRVDFALRGRGRGPAIFIEVKGVGRSMEGDRQLFEYAFHEGVPICVLTDGREWSFYLPSGQGTYNDRRFYRLQLDERPPSESAHMLVRYLERARVHSDQARTDAEKDYRNAAAKREADRFLAEAWKMLVEEPEDLLIDLLSDQVEQMCGFRPDEAACLRFLRALNTTTGAAAGPPVAPGQPAQTPPQTEPVVRRRRTQSNGRAVSYRLFGKNRTARSANEAFVDILSELAGRRPDRLPEFAVAARSRKRNHVAQSVEEVYPSRPDLANAVEFTPGWLVGLNIANREKMRIIRAACEAFGVRMGTDLDIELPNA